MIDSCQNTCALDKHRHQCFIGLLKIYFLLLHYLCFLLVPPPPKNVEVVIPDGSDHGYVYVKWNKPECVTNLACGYAEEFILVYCLVSSVDNEACVGMLFYDC